MFPPYCLMSVLNRAAKMILLKNCQTMPFFCTEYSNIPSFQSNLNSLKWPMRHRIWPILHLPPHLPYYSILCAYHPVSESQIRVYPQGRNMNNVVYPWSYDSAWITADAQKSIYWALAGVVQLINWLSAVQYTKRSPYWPLFRVHAQVVDSIPSQAVYKKKLIDVSHIDIFSLSPSSPPLPKNWWKHIFLKGIYWVKWIKE